MKRLIAFAALFLAVPVFAQQFPAGTPPPPPPGYTTADMKLYLNPTTGNDRSKGCPANYPCATCAGVRQNIPANVLHRVDVYAAGGSYYLPPYVNLDAGALEAACDFGGVNILSSGPYADGAYVHFNGAMSATWPSSGTPILAQVGSAVSDGTGTHVTIQVNPDGGSGTLFPTDGGLVGQFLAITAGTGLGALPAPITANTVNTVTYQSLTTPDTTTAFLVEYPSTILRDDLAGAVGTSVASHVISRRGGQGRPQFYNVVLVSNASTPEVYVNAGLLGINDAVYEPNGQANYVASGSLAVSDSVRIGGTGSEAFTGGVLSDSFVYVTSQTTGFADEAVSNGVVNLSDFDFSALPYCAGSVQTSYATVANGTCYGLDGGFISTEGGVLYSGGDVIGTIPANGAAGTQGCWLAQDRGTIELKDATSTCTQVVTASDGGIYSPDGGLQAYFVIGLPAADAGFAANVVYSKSTLEATTSKTETDAVRLSVGYEQL